jgi:hypothetical protein
MRILMRLCETKSHEISWPSLMRLPVEIALNHPKLCLGACADAQNVLGSLNGLLALFGGLCIVLLSSVFSGGAMWGRSTIYHTILSSALLRLRPFLMGRTHVIHRRSVDVVCVDFPSLWCFFLSQTNFVCDDEWIRANPMANGVVVMAVAGKVTPGGAQPYSW